MGVASSDSLKAVLLGAGCGSGKRPSSALTWHSLRSVVSTGDNDPPGHYFPSKLAMAGGLLKLLFSVLTVILGAVSIVTDSSLSSLGAGIWVGVVVGVSGFLGVCAGRHPHIRVYIVSFLSVNILSVAASGALVVLAATAWARDSKSIFLFDKETKSPVDILGWPYLSRPSILLSGSLVALGTLDIFASLACVVLSAREACGPATSAMGIFTISNGPDNKARLYRWLGQQNNFPPLSSAPKGGSCSSSQFLPQRPHTRSPKDSMVKGSRSSMEGKNSAIIFMHPQIDEVGHNWRGPRTHPAVSCHPPGISPMDLQMAPFFWHRAETTPHPRCSVPVMYPMRQCYFPQVWTPRGEKAPGKKQKGKKKSQKKDKVGGLTDEQIERTYTGLDRRIAEGFINSSMEPAASQRQVAANCSDQGSF